MKKVIQKIKDKLKKKPTKKEIFYTLSLEIRVSKSNIIGLANQVISAFSRYSRGMLNIKIEPFEKEIEVREEKQEVVKPEMTKEDKKQAETFAEIEELLKPETNFKG